MTAPDITAAIAAAAKAIPVDPDDGTCIVAYGDDGIPLWSMPHVLAQVILEAAAPVLLAEHRELIAREIEQAGRRLLTFGGDGHEIEMLKAASYSRAKALGDAAAIARGSRPATDSGGEL